MLRIQWRRVRSRYPWLQMLQTWRCWFIVTCIVIVILYMGVALRHRPITFFEEEIHEIWLGNIEFDFQTGLYFLKEDKTVFLRGSMADSLQMNGPPTHCATYNKSQNLCASWYPFVKLEVFNHVDEHASCQSLTWTPTFNSYSPSTCFSMSDHFWYGGSLLYNQTWPLNYAVVKEQPFQAQDLASYEGEVNIIGNVMDWFWINSAGVAVMFDSQFPVKISVNQSGDNLLCFSAAAEMQPTLKYKICKAANLRKIHRYVTSKMIHLPLGLPHDRYFQYPLWSSYPIFAANLNQQKILKYTKDIMDHKFARSLFEIHDNSIFPSTSDFSTFNKTKFPNSHQALTLIKGDYGFKNFISVSPFVAKNEKNDPSKLVLDHAGKPVIGNWNGQKVNIVNLLEVQVYEWFVKKLKDLKDQFLVEGFRLFGGEADLLSKILKNLQPSTVNKLSQQLSKVAEDLQITTISTFASKSQKSAGLIALSSHTSTWGSRGGLRSVIPSVLTLSVLGYPYVIPNLVGGPGVAIRSKMKNVTGESIEEKPEEELYQRWLAVSAYMPCMMFSIPPWLYSSQTLELAHQLAQVHEQVVSPLVIKASREYEISGSPIIRPLWWLDPTDKTSQTVSDQFLIGDTLMVAPILEAGCQTRDIYLPSGRWLDILNQKELDGKTWLKKYHIEINQVATFSSVKS